MKLGHRRHTVVSRDDHRPIRTVCGARRDPCCFATRTRFTSGMTGVASPSGGQGRLAQLLASRGGKAAPEAPFVIEHREALIYMLCEAAELEHGIMCQYLFAAFTLKQRHRRGTDGRRARGGQPLAPCDRARGDRGDVAPRAGAQPAVGDRRGAPFRSSQHAGAGEPLSGRCAARAGSVRRACAAALHVPRAARGNAARGRAGLRRRARARDPVDGGARHRPPRAGLRDCRPSLPLDRARLRAAGREVRRASAVRRSRRGRRRPPRTSAGRSSWPSPTSPRRSARSTRSSSRARARAATGRPRTSASSSRSSTSTGR